jgi:putative selenate reductase
MNALDFLQHCKKTETSSETFLPGKDIVIIGGGNTAMDAARAAKRLPGVENVSLVYRRTVRYMPAAEEELILAKEEGVQFKELLSPVTFEAGKLQCCKILLGEPDEKGRRRPVLTNELVDIPADMVVAAVGEQIDTKIFADNGIIVTEKGYVKTEFNTLTTDLERIYVIGDAVLGPATVVEAIRDASKATDDIIKKLAWKDQENNIDNNIEEKSQKAVTEINNRENIAIMKKGTLLQAKDANHESDRCLECSTICECCVDVCPNRANIAIKNRHGGMPQIIHVDIMCNECGNCESFCPYDSAPYREKFTLFHTIKGFEDSKNQGFLILEHTDQKEVPITATTNRSDIIVRVRLGDKVIDTSLDNEVGELPLDIAELIQQVYDEYRYLVIA